MHNRRSRRSYSHRMSGGSDPSKVASSETVGRRITQNQQKVQRADLERKIRHDVLGRRYPAQMQLIQINDNPLYDVPQKYRDNPVARILREERQTRPILGKFTFFIADDTRIDLEDDDLNEAFEIMENEGYFKPFTLENPSIDSLREYIHSTRPMVAEFDNFIGGMELQKDGTIMLGPE